LSILKKKIPPHFPLTSDILTANDERKITERLPKYKYLIIIQKPEKIAIHYTLLFLKKFMKRLTSINFFSRSFYTIFAP